MNEIIIAEPRLSRFLFSSTASSWLWLVVRIYVGWEWAVAGWEKIMNPAWVGPASGGALSGFLRGALAKTAGTHPDVQGWYAWFLEHAVLPHVSGWSHLVAYGELAVGVALMLGMFVGIAAFFGLFMNLSYLLAGTVSTNPVLLVLSIALILSWKVAGYIGLDRYLMPLLGVPWQLGSAFGKKE